MDTGKPKYEDPQSINRYVYCLNNPITLSDPNGFDPRPIAYFYKILNPGDVIAVHSSNLIAGTIQSMTGSFWNHVAIYIGNGQIIEMTPTGGIQKNQLSDAVASTSIIGVFSPTNISESVISKAVRFADEALSEGKGYDFWGLFSGGLLRDYSGKKYICSELVYSAYDYAGIQLVNRDLLVDPGEITRSPYLSRIDYSEPQLSVSDCENSECFNWSLVGLLSGFSNNGVSFGWSY